MLAAFLLSVAVGLLAVVAWRLEQIEHMQVGRGKAGCVALGNRTPLAKTSWVLAPMRERFRAHAD